MEEINKICGIYKITSPSGKIYIGQSKDIKTRWSRYRNSQYNRQPRICNSLKKYGAENHQFDIIEYCSEDDLDCSERFWQDEFDVMGKNGLNCVLTQCGEKRQVMAREARDRAANKRRGHKNSPETIMRMREAAKNRETKNRGKKVRNKKTHEIYETTKEVSKLLGIDTGTLTRYLKGKAVNKTDFEYLDESLRPTNMVFNENNTLILDLNTGVFYYSIVEANKVVRVCSTLFSRMLNGHIENTTNLIKI